MSVVAMFTDLYPRVITESHAEEGRPPDEVLNLGHYAVERGTDTFDESRFDAEFYRQAGVPFLAKWEKFSIPITAVSALEGEWGYKPVALPRFIHDDAARGFVIPLGGYRPDKTRGTVFSHCPELMGAEEIHCISSSFAILADLMDTPGKKFLHKYARPDGGALPVLGRGWTILDKPL